MKVKLDFEDDVNAWLALHHDLKIIDIKQSSNGGSFDTTKVVISIWYDAYADHETAPDAPPGAKSQGVHSIQPGRTI
jgi:hypothetical protein